MSSVIGINRPAIGAVVPDASDAGGHQKKKSKNRDKDKNGERIKDKNNGKHKNKDKDKTAEAPPDKDRERKEKKRKRKKKHRKERDNEAGDNGREHDAQVTIEEEEPLEGMDASEITAPPLPQPHQNNLSHGDDIQLTLAAVTIQRLLAEEARKRQSTEEEKEQTSVDADKPSKKRRRKEEATIIETPQAPTFDDEHDDELNQLIAVVNGETGSRQQHQIEKSSRQPQSQTVMQGGSSAPGAGAGDAEREMIAFIPANLDGTTLVGFSSAQPHATSSSQSSQQKHVDTIWEALQADTRINELQAQWYSYKELDRLAAEKGLSYKKGQWSKTEDQLLREAVQRYMEMNGISQERLEAMLFKETTRNNKEFWQAAARPLPDRPLRAVYHHCKRIFNPENYKGPWTAAEDLQLKELVAQHGQNWKVIGEHLGRMGEACKDRWRNYLKDGDKKKSGRWTAAEEEQLRNIIEELMATSEEGRLTDSDIMWNLVSERMGHTRSREQCRQKYHLKLRNMVDGRAREWTRRDDRELLEKIRGLDARDDSEIVWSKLPGGWDGRRNYVRWKAMKKRVVECEGKSPREVAEILLKRIADEDIQSFVDE
ncbi:uncharacterized protein VTP21DRAFT_5281 [Calcarisporiella thermophila]|uniref:uncharacterized protein n=1 Tax=Calcarisporiella thermophila TaxID=911321 RepID=UPI0037448890